VGFLLVTCVLLFIYFLLAAREIGNGSERCMLMYLLAFDLNHAQACQWEQVQEEGPQEDPQGREGEAQARSAQWSLRRARRHARSVVHQVYIAHIVDYADRSIASVASVFLLLNLIAALLCFGLCPRHVLLWYDNSGVQHVSWNSLVLDPDGYSYAMLIGMWMNYMSSYSSKINF
jgi:hypothetical protein